MVVGDKVIIRPDIKFGYETDVRCYVNSYMQSLRGKLTTIQKVSVSLTGLYCYAIALDNGAWTWTDKMLLPIRQRTE